MTPDQIALLASDFPQEDVHWRAQTVTRDGNKALALAYIDARNVMDRLDLVCGAGGWRNHVVETPKGRLIATIEIKIDGEWVGKTDGAGDTDVEGAKGGISDALKRAAVLWGVGRYLYAMPNVWCPCESRDNNGKKQWTKWTDTPWNHVPGANRSRPKPDTSEPNITSEQHDVLKTLLEASSTSPVAVCEHYGIASLNKLPAGRYEGLRRNLSERAKA